MRIYKLWEFHIPNSVFEFEFKKKRLDLKVANEYVALKAPDKRELSLNISTTKAKFQVDNIIYTSELINAKDYKVTKFKQLGSLMPYVVHKGNFDKDAILKELFLLEIKDSNNEEIKFSVEVLGENVKFTFTSPKSVTIELKDKYYINSQANDNLDYKDGSFSIKALSSFNEVKNKILSVPPSVQLVDNDISEYYLVYDIDNQTLIKKELQLSDEYVIDKYASVLIKLKDIPISANIHSVYFYEEERYPDNNEYAVVLAKENKIYSTEISRVISSMITIENSKPMYNYGLFRSTDRLFPSYAYVSSSYAYISFSRAKASLNECQYSDDNSLELALKLKIKKNNQISITKDNTVSTILNYKDEQFANEYLKALKKGFGVFSNSLFTLKRYKDEGSHIYVYFNYQNSKNYYKLDIYDEATRYKIIETKKVNSQTTQNTKYYGRYKHNSEFFLNSTKTYLNMLKKEHIDYMSDVDTGIYYVSTFKVPPLTVINKSNALVFNPNNFDVEFEHSKVSTSLLGMTAIIVDGSLKIYDIYYQGTSDTIYVIDTDTKERVDIDTFRELFNESTNFYKLESSCSYAVFKYKNLDNQELSVEFPISTIFLTELVNSVNGVYHRTYYKNINDIGMFESLQYQIIEL